MAKKADTPANQRHDDGPGEDMALRDRLDNLDKAIRTRQAKLETPDVTRRGTAIGIAFRLATELVAGLVVGGGIGWFLDYLLGTSPFMLLVFFFLGAAAGVLTVYKTAGELQKQQTPDDEET